jgi:ParB-like chromosome segregation protein Spo0J
MPLDIASAIEVPELTIDKELVYDSADAIERLPVEHMPLSRLTPGFFQRGAGTDPAHVQMLVEAASAAELPAILVQASNSRIVDGMHRYEAAKIRGDETIPVRLINCTDKDAFILAVKANIWHGLPLSRADRMSGAKQIVEWHPDWSDRAIGMATGLSAKTIAGIRRQNSDETQLQSGKRLGRDGKRRPIAASEGRRRAAEYLALRPDAPLREIAREADVALATAQDVRARIRRGVDPIAPRRNTQAAEGADQGSGLSEACGTQRSWAPNDTDSAAPVLRSSAPPAPNWSALSPKLANDPSLKYTDAGRAFVGWMVMHVVDEQEWKKFVDTIPVHWLQHLSLIAGRVGQEWLEFAEELQRRQGRIDS